MKFGALNILSFLVLVSIVSCLDVQEEVEITPAKVVANSMENFNFNPGDRNGFLNLDNGSILNYRIHIPDSVVAGKTPMILALHWAGNNNSYLDYHDCLVRPALDTTNAIIFTPSYATGEWWLADIESILLSFLDLAEMHWPINPDLTTFVGYSNGASASYLYAEKRSNYMGAAILMAGNYQTIPTFTIPMYVIHGTNDELFGFQGTKNVIEQSVDSGSDITFIEATDKSHFEGCNYIEELEGAAVWLLENVY